MFGWFSAPRCPVGTREKAWTEWRMLWLSDQFGRDRLLCAEVVLPRPPFFPKGGGAPDARPMLDRLCAALGIDPAVIDLEVGLGDSQSQEAPPPRREASCVSIQERPGGVALPPSGIQERPAPIRHVVRVSEGELAEPMLLASTLAHGLARVLLQGRLSPMEDDYEFVVDLLPVYFGAGIFGANATLMEFQEWDDSGGWWTALRRGALTARVFGYAMALFAWLRAETSPAWARALRPDAAAALSAGLRYLRRTGDSQFRPDVVGVTRVRDPDEVMARLAGGTASERLVALWDVSAQGLLGPAWATAVTQRLGDRDPEVTSEAARVLASFGGDAAPALPRLRAALRAGDHDVCAAAAWALGELRLEPDAVVPELCQLLDQSNNWVFAAVATALARYGAPIDPVSLKRLLGRFAAALSAEQEDLIAAVARALLATQTEPERHVREYFEHNTHRRAQAITVLAEFRKEAEAADARWRLAGTVQATEAAAHSQREGT